MLRTIKSKKYNYVIKPVVVISILALLVCSTAQPVLSAMQFDGTKLFKDNNLSIINFDGADTLSDESVEVKKAIETKFAGEGAIEYKFALKFSARNTDIFIVPIIGRGFFYCILKKGEQTSFFFPARNDNAFLNSDKQYFNLVDILNDEMSTLSSHSSKDNTSYQTSMNAIVKYFTLERFIHTELCVRDDNGNCINDDDDGGGTPVVTLLIVGLLLFYYYSIFLPPSVEIISPTDNSYYHENECISFKATADSPNGFGLPYNCTWSSNVDGTLGSGFDLQQCGLSLGEHSITVKCENAFGLPAMPGEDSRTITILKTTTTSIESTTTTFVVSTTSTIPTTTTTSITTTPTTTTTTIPPLNEGLIAYYPFNGNATDESGNGNNGTVNGATLTTDRFGNANSAYSFDGNNVITIPNSSSLNPANITVACWVNFARFAYGDGYSGTQGQFIICKGGDQTPGSYILSQGGYSPTSPILTFEIAPFYNQWYIQSSPPLETNRWYYIAGTYDGQTMSLYLDGNLLGSQYVGSIPVGNSSPLYFSYNDVGGYPYYLTGQIDDILINSRALSGAEIQTLYNQ